MILVILRKKDILLVIRAREHKYQVRKNNENNAMIKNHLINWGSVKIIYKSTNYINRKLVESALISSLPNINISSLIYYLKNIINNSIKEDKHLLKSVLFSERRK